MRRGLGEGCHYFIFVKSHSFSSLNWLIAQLDRHQVGQSLYQYWILSLESHKAIRLPCQDGKSTISALSEILSFIIFVKLKLKFLLSREHE